MFTNSKTSCLGKAIFELNKNTSASNMNSVIIVGLILTGFSSTTVNAGSFKILGGFIKEYLNHENGDYYGKTYKWGQAETDSHSKELEIESMTCWTLIVPAKGFCRHFLVVSTKDDPNEEHYQIVGSNLRIYKNGVLLNSKNEYGIISNTPPIQEIHVANGKTWCQRKGDFRYGEMYFYVNKTTQPSVSDDYSTIHYKQGHPDQHTDEVFVETHDPTSVRVVYSDFKKWMSPWGTKGYEENSMWMAPTTLVDATPLQDQAQSKGISTNTRKEVVLRNEGSGVTSPDLPILGTSEEVTYTNEGRIMSSQDFGFSIDETISFTVFSVESSLGMSQSFSYHSEEELTQSQSYTITQTVTWPKECPAGFQITYKIEETTEEQTLPIQMTFKRAGVKWTEINWMDVSLQKIVLAKDDCCIYEDADPSCGSDRLEMCPNSFQSEEDRNANPLPDLSEVEQE